MLNLIGAIVAFIVIIFLIRRKVNFAFSIILGSLILGVFSLNVIDLIDIPKTIVAASFYSFEKNRFETTTIELAILMTLIYILAKSMQETDAIKELIDSLKTFFAKGGLLGVIPAIYGLMSTVGGALFSAPMVDEEGDKYHLSINQKNYLNIWFRHISFPIYPVLPAMILICSSEFANINIYDLMFINLPAFITSIVIGILFLKYFVNKGSYNITRKVGRKKGGLIFLLPPTIPLFFYAFLQFFGYPQIRSFLIGAIASIITLYFLREKNLKGSLSIIKRSLSWKFAAAIFGIMIFRKMVEVSRVNTIIAEIISRLSLPGIIVIIIIPLLLGVLMGNNLGAIALSYPIVEPLLESIPINILNLTSIIYISTFVGYIISPIHLCNVLSSEYLKTDTAGMYGILIPSAFLVLIINSAILIM